jgi:hypothetical protein
MTLKRRFGWTAAIALVYTFFIWAFTLFQGSIEAQMGAKQFEDDTVSYGIGRAFATANIESWVLLLCTVLLLFIWVPLAWARIKLARSSVS